MISFLPFFITFASSLKQIKPLPSEYVLVEGESYSLNLDEYIIGDNLQFEINSGENLEILNPPSRINQTVVQTGINASSPSHVSQFLLLRQFLINQYLVYASSENLYFFELVLYQAILSKFYVIESESILQIQKIDRNIAIDILILCEFSKLFYVRIIDLYSEIIWNSIQEIEVKLPETQAQMSEGEIGKLLLITGYEENKGYAYFYRIDNIDSPYLYRNFCIAETNDGSFPIMLSYTLAEMNSLTYSFFVIVPIKSQIFKFASDYQDDLKLLDVLFLPVFAQNVTSFGITSDRRLFVGVKGGFVVISLDFKQIYMNVGIQEFENVYVSSENDEDLILAGTGSNYSLIRLGNYYNNVANVSFIIQEKSFMWKFFNIWSDFYLIYGITDKLYYERISFSSANLLFNSSEKDKNYSLKVTQHEPYSVLFYNFTVKRPSFDLPGYIEMLPVHQVVAEFKDFESNVMVPLQNYLIGGNLTITYANISLIEPQNKFFNTSLKITGNLVQSSTIPLDFHNFTNIIASEDNIILYNSTSLSIYSDGNMTDPFNFINTSIKEIKFCESGFLMYFQNTETNELYLMFLSKYLYIQEFNISLSEECKTLLCSPVFVVCEQKMQTIVFQIFAFNSFEGKALNNSDFNSNITSMSLSPFYTLLVLYDGCKVALVMIEELFLYETDPFRLDFSLNYPSTKIYYSNFGIFIQDTKNVIRMYDLSLNSRKPFKVLDSSIIHITGYYLVSQNLGELLIIDISQLVTNSTITSVSLTKPLDLSSNFYSETLSLYFLYENSIVEFQIPALYNSLNVSAKIIDFTSIDEIGYMALIDLEVANNFSTLCFQIPLLLYVNGETIFKNLTSIKRVQQEEMSYQCGEYHEVPIDDLFLGQGLDVRIENPNKFVSIKDRFNRTSYLSFMEFDQVVYSQAYEKYIVNVGCNVTVFDSNLNEISQSFLANRHLETCNCSSIAIISEHGFISFVLGCSVKSLIFDGGDNIEYFNNILYFGIFNDKILSIVNRFNVSYQVGIIKTASKVSGEFLLVCCERFEVSDKNTFYSSHLMLIEGVANENGTYAQLIECDFAEIFDLNFYYLTDVEIIYDPMFNISYIYSLDFYYGLRIFSYSLGFCKAENSYEFQGVHTGYSLSICGKFLHVVMQDTDILIYSIINNCCPVYLRTIQTFTQIFKVIQGTMRCSSNSNPEYLLFQMTSTNSSVYLHLLDTQSNNMANTLTNYQILTNSSSSLPPTYSAFLNDSNSLIIITSESSKQFSINSFKLVINTGNNCHKNFKGNFSLDVSNANQRKNSTSFELRVSFYSQGSVSSSSMNLWELLLICIGTLAISLLLFALIRKKILRTRPKKTQVLFSYENDFFEGGPNINKTFEY